jgi:hypothetical protein
MVIFAGLAWYLLPKGRVLWTLVDLCRRRFFFFGPALPLDLHRLDFWKPIWRRWICELRVASPSSLFVIELSDLNRTVSKTCRRRALPILVMKWFCDSFACSASLLTILRLSKWHHHTIFLLCTYLPSFGPFFETARWYNKALSINLSTLWRTGTFFILSCLWQFCLRHCSWGGGDDHRSA